MRIVIDTDPAMGSKGGDPEDSFALMLALASPEVTVEGVTIVQGNVPVAHGYPNACHLLELLGRSDVPVLAGATEPLGPERETQRRWLARRGELPSLVPPREPAPGDPDAADFLIRTVRENPGEITLVTIGPLTNVALALQREPRLARDAAGLVAMAGAVTVPGNITPAAEFNVWADPEAAAAVFAAGMPTTLVGLDVCHQTHLRLEQIESLENGESELARFVFEAVTPWMELRRRTEGEADLHLYDSLAVASAFRPQLLGCEDAFLAVETEGTHTEGETVAYRGLQLGLWRRQPNAKVATRVDAAGFEAMFEERVLKRLCSGGDPRRSR